MERYIQSRYSEGQGNSPLPSSLRGLDRSFPEIVYVLYDIDRDRRIFMHARYPNVGMPEAITEQFEGLACFRTFDAALATARDLSRERRCNFEPVPIPFELARSIAKAETNETAALILADATDYPLVHFVR